MDHHYNTAVKGAGSLKEAIKGSPVSRRWLLRNSANAAAGVIAVSAFGGSAAPALDAQPIAASAVDTQTHADKPAGYVHSLHGWDTI